MSLGAEAQIISVGVLQKGGKQHLWGPFILSEVFSPGDAAHLPGWVEACMDGINRLWVEYNLPGWVEACMDGINGLWVEYRMTLQEDEGEEAGRHAY